MSPSADDIFESVVETRFDICRRCFETAKSARDRDSFDGGPSCGEDCGSMSATLEDGPIRRDEIEGRAPRLLSLIQEEGYDINEEAYMEAVDIIAGVSEPPRSVLLDAIRAGIGEVSPTDLLEEYDIESEVEQQTRQFLRDLPSTDVSQQDLEEIDEQVAEEVTTVTDSHRPGSNVYYLLNSGSIPDQYCSTIHEGHSPSEVMSVVVEEKEGWFWSASADTVDDWLSELDDEFCDCVANCLYQHIGSRNRRATSDSPPVDEQFRRTGLWPVLKDDAEEMLGYLRRNDGPQPLEEVAEYVDLSESTARTVLTVLETAERSNYTSPEHWYIS